jgi:hypothetical protein
MLDFTPGRDKSDLVRTLIYFDVNRVNHYSIDEWLKLPFKEKGVWSVRSYHPSWPGFGWGVTSKDIILLINNGKIDFKKNYICDSMMYNDKNHLICNGESMLYIDEYKTWNFMGFVNYQKGMSVREASGNTKLITIKNRHQVPKSIFNLTWEKKLKDFVIEFSIYDVPVGIKKEKTLIWEIRKY